jgi:soluble cytochrome b562
MKRALLFSIMLLLSAHLGFSKEKTVKLTVVYEFKGIEEGFDHLSIGKLQIDGANKYETAPHLQSAKQQFTVDVAKSLHDIKLDLYAQWEGEYELHSIDNGYSVDCIVQTAYEFKKKAVQLKVVFDLDNDMSFSIE